MWCEGPCGACCGELGLAVGEAAHTPCPRAQCVCEGEAQGRSHRACDAGVDAELLEHHVEVLRVDAGGDAARLRVGMEGGV